MRFELLDGIDLIVPGRCARGHTAIDVEKEYFREHFPGYPIVPGVLILESMAQLGGRLVQITVRTTGGMALPVLAKVERAEFRRPVRPGARMLLSADLSWISDEGARVTTTAIVDGCTMASAKIMYALVSLTGHGSESELGDLEALRAWSEAVWSSEMHIVWPSP
jgi:3-hydroxyacyl-[acyl-carrier-protein] dehydratase